MIVTPCAYAFLFLTFFSVSAQQVSLPAPGGEYGVGKHYFEWAYNYTALNSKETIARNLPVTIFYPSANSLNKSEFQILNGQLQIQTSAITGAAVHQGSETYPLILFIPGRGTHSSFYTVLAEGLASSGFVVIITDLPLIGYARYADGSNIPASKDYKPPPGMMGGPYEKVDAFFEIPTAMGVSDLEFVLTQLHQLQDGSIASNLNAQLDLDSMGIFGHSLGGRIAGAFANIEPRIAAYAAMEGIPPRSIRYEGLLKCPSLMLCSKGTWPYAKDNYHSFIDNRSAPVTMVLLEDFNHNSITDAQYIEEYTSGDPGSGKNNLITARELLREFFKRLLYSEIEDDSPCKEYGVECINYLGN